MFLGLYFVFLQPPLLPEDPRAGCSRDGLSAAWVFCGHGSGDRSLPTSVKPRLPQTAGDV